MTGGPTDPALQLPIDTVQWARVMNALAGGVHHHAEDRALAAEIEARWPGAGEQIRREREFRARAAEWAVREKGVRGIIAAPAGFPVSPDPYERALAAHPGVRAVLAAPGAETSAVNRAVLAADPRLAAVRASVRDPRGLLSAPEVRALPRPWCLLIPYGPTWWPADIAAGLFAAYGELLPSGSVLAVTMGIPGDEAVADAWSRIGGPVYVHEPEDLQAWLEDEDAGMRVEPPGVRDIRAWGRPDWWDANLPQRGPGQIVEAVAVVP